jgi:hypothetical protein
VGSLDSLDLLDPLGLKDNVEIQDSQEPREPLATLDHRAVLVQPVHREAQAPAETLVRRATRELLGKRASRASVGL